MSIDLDQQLLLMRAPVAPLPRKIDLRNDSIDAVLAELEAQDRDKMRAHLVVADPPWPRYDQQPGSVDPEAQYDLLSYEAIYAHLERAALVSRPRARLLLWATWPLLVQWLDHPKALRRVVPRCWTPKSGGAWLKQSDSPGTGYHWQGATEPAIVFVREGKGRTYTDPKAMVDNGWASDRGRHSRKPPHWQAQCIRRWVPRGGLVLDLYAGLGSVAEATIYAGEDRRYIGAEIGPRRYEEARALVHHNTTYVFAPS